MRTLALIALMSSMAQAGPVIGTLLVDTPMRGAPRADALDAGSLVKGTTVIVHHEEGDWLALQPPRGSVSWIGHLFLEFPDRTPNAGFPKNAVVRSDGEVKLAVGKAGLAKPLDVRKSSVPDGTIVLVIGPSVKGDADRTQWYPIVSPEDDFRYVLKSAVQIGGSAAPGFVVNSPAATSHTPMPVPAAIAGPTPVATKAAWPNHPLWLQAEQAESSGDLDRAEKLYFELARLMNAPGGDGELANQCYSRVHAIRERRRGGSRDSSFRSAPVEEKKAIQPAKWEATEAESTPRVAPTRTTAATPPSPTADGAKWTGSGFLRIAGFKLDGQQAYALEDSRGRLMYYALAGTSDLDRYRNKTVDLYGTMTAPKDLRGVSLVEVSKIDQVK